MSDCIQRLQEWYESHCDGDWEHGAGIRIETLDNPGWRVVIDLEGTPLEGREFREIAELLPERDWIRCWVAENRFEGAGGPKRLSDIVRIFLAMGGTAR